MAGLSRRPWVDARGAYKIPTHWNKTEAQTRLGIKMLCCRDNVSLWNPDSIQKPLNGRAEDNEEKES